MKLILASKNKGKIKEFQRYLTDFEVVAYSDILGDFEIVENGKSFKENAIIKAKAIYDKVENKNSLILSDDSGISIKALNNEPGIYSARYSKSGDDKDNNDLVIKKLKEKNLTSSSAYYTAALALIYKGNIYTTHGFMHGRVITTTRGNNGFGYDPLFIPNNFYNTLGELDDNIKERLSHRIKALKLMKLILKAIL